MKPRMLVLVSIDTEEDNWLPTREGLTVENIRELPRMGELFRRLGIRPTFFTTYQVAATPWAADIVRGEAERCGGEVGAHLHPWNTPPLGGPEPRRYTMLNNYPPGFVLAKLRTLTDTLAAATGRSPTSFRAGRFGLGPATVRALIKLGYLVDSSVTPLLSWGGSGGGPDYVDAPWTPYRLDGFGSVVVPVPGGPLIEIPLSVGFTGLQPRWWRGLAHLLHRTPVRRTHIFGLAAALGLVQRVIVSPETSFAQQMVAACRGLVRAGATHLHLFFHSSSLRPGLTPFARTEADVQRLRDRISGFVEGITEVVDPVFCTVGEAGSRLGQVVQQRAS